MLPAVIVLRRRRTGRLALAALGLLLMQAWVLALPLLHATQDGEHAGRATAVSAFVAACPLDCKDPGHEHRGHDPATCASCHAGRFVATAARAIRLDLGARLAISVEALALVRPTRSDDTPPRLRGPPVPSFVS